jgi:hypothetical protein
MTELTIRNQDILDQLEYVRSAVMNANIDQYIEGVRYSPEDARVNGESYLTKEWLDKHMADPEHKGFPVEHFSVPIEGIMDKDPKLEEVYNFSRVDFISNLGANANAVFLYYPPGGFVGWHTNQNNSGYQFIFSYSEKGDGYFQYYDKQKQEIVKCPDVSGWNARYYHFGEDEPDHCWHSAYTNVPRITICVLFRWWDKPHLKDQILAMKDQLIEEIEMEI